MLSAVRVGRSFANRPFLMGLPQQSRRSFAVLNINDSETARAKLSDPNGLKVVNWSATWCGPCKMVAPIVEKLSEEHPEVSFYRIDVDDCADVASEAGVNSMPTFHFIANDEVVDQQIGANPESLLQKFHKFTA